MGLLNDLNLILNYILNSRRSFKLTLFLNSSQFEWNRDETLVKTLRNEFAYEIILKKLQDKDKENSKKPSRESTNIDI